MIRSYLFVPGDSERKFLKALASDADALIIDLEDAVSPPSKPLAREQLAGFLGQTDGPELWVRINPLDTEDSRLDVAALEARPPAGVVLPKATGKEDIRTLDTLLTSMEKSAGIDQGSTRVLPLVTERPAALFRLHEYAEVPDRLNGLTWGAEDLAAAIGAQRNKDADGGWLPPYQLARSLCLIAAAAAGLPAVETVFTDIRDVHGAGRAASAARRDGFSGMLAIHPAQIGPINAAFTPGADEIERARRIVELFDSNAGAGVMQLDGEMLDRPHYLQARRLLDVAERAHGR